MISQRTALISVYHKEGVAEFARELKNLGWNILASGGTAKCLAESGVEVTDIATLVGEPILGHRVVTLSREVHAGLLAKRSPEHLAELEKNHIPFIDLVCVDLYPLEEEIAHLRPSSAESYGRAQQGFGGQAKGKEREMVIEMTDIGGPAMLRSAAKGGRIVVCAPADRARVLEWLKAHNDDNPVRSAGADCGAGDDLVRELAAKAEATVAKYVLASATYLGEGEYAGVFGTRTAECLYGENAWQAPAALYATGTDDPLSLDRFQLVEGTPLSYNNWCDTDRLLQTLTHVAAALETNPVKSAGADHGAEPRGGHAALRGARIAVAVKHGNPCGAAYGPASAEGSGEAKEILERMIAGDPLAIMGGVVMTNFPIGAAEAETLASFKMEGGARRLLDVVIAPSFDAAAIELLRRKKDKCRFVANEALSHAGITSLDAQARIRYVRGGFLRQPNYAFVLNLKDAAVKKYGPAASPEAECDLAFTWAVGSTSNSNTIALAKGGMLLGDGVGQQDRVGAAELAIKRARRGGHDTNGAVAYSDSFFPFPDAPQVLIDAGIRAILSTSGSVRDEDTIKLCEAKGVSLYLIPDKEGRGFFGH